MTTEQAQRALEAALFCAGRPLPLNELCTLLNDEVAPDTVRRLLDNLAEDYRDRGIELVCLESGWRIQNRPEMQVHLERLNPQRAPRYSKALLETLACIAFRQPVTRTDIEEMRGAGVSPAILQQLQDRGWVEVIGYRATPGKPELLATTTRFLDDLKIMSLDDLVEGLDVSLPAKKASGPVFDIASTVPLADVPAGTPLQDWEQDEDGTLDWLPELIPEPEPSQALSVPDRGEPGTEPATASAAPTPEAPE